MVVLSVGVVVDIDVVCVDLFVGCVGVCVDMIICDGVLLLLVWVLVLV